MNHRKLTWNLTALAIAIVITFIAGWAGIRDIRPLFYLGFIGAVPMMLITGVHGGGTSLQNAIGYTVFVLANAAFYYYIVRWSIGCAIDGRRK
jgi:hypothetical protein